MLVISVTRIKHIFRKSYCFYCEFVFMSPENAFIGGSYESVLFVMLITNMIFDFWVSNGLVVSIAVLPL